VCDKPIDDDFADPYDGCDDDICDILFRLLVCWIRGIDEPLVSYELPFRSGRESLTNKATSDAT